MGSAELYSIAGRSDLDAQQVAHDIDPETRACRPRCWRCYLDARARLYGRAGDAAKRLEDRA